MAFDEGLAQRIRETLQEMPAEVDEKRMFGGLAFMVAGNLCVGVIGSELLARVGPDRYEAALALEHAREMDFTGRPMKGIVYVGEDGIESDAGLQSWIGRAFEFASSLPPK